MTPQLPPQLLEKSGGDMKRCRAPINSLDNFTTKCEAGRGRPIIFLNYNEDISFLVFVLLSCIINTSRLNKPHRLRFPDLILMKQLYPRGRVSPDCCHPRCWDPDQQLESVISCRPQDTAALILCDNCATFLTDLYWLLIYGPAYRYLFIGG